jgi:hypothetical protein
MITETKEVCFVKNKTLVVNMQHVKFNAIPPVERTEPTGVECSYKTTTIKNSENINGRYRQSPTKRRD